MPDRRSFLARWPLLAGLGPVLTACERAPARSGATAQPLRVAMDLWAGYFPALLAESLGLFRRDGLLVELRLPGNTAAMAADLLAGRHDLACLSLGDLVNLTRGSDELQVILQSDESAGGDQLLRRPGAPAAGQALVLGTQLGGFGELLLRAYLERQGVGAGEVRWVSVDAADVPAALARGDIDVGHTWDPYARAARQAGARVVFTSADVPGLIPDVVAGLRRTIDRRSAELRRFCAAWFEAAAWWQAHPAEGAQQLARRLERDPAWVNDAAAGVRLLTVADNRRALGGDGGPPALAATLQRYSAYFVRQGTLARPLQPATVLRADLLPPAG